jgi:hypothetical protein
MCVCVGTVHMLQPEGPSKNMNLGVNFLAADFDGKQTIPAPYPVA